MQVRHFKRGQRIFRVDDKDNIAYFILAGKVELYQEEPAHGPRAQELAQDAELLKLDETVLKLKKVKSKQSLRVNVTQSNFASLLMSPTKLDDVPVTVGRHMIKTFSEILEQN